MKRQKLKICQICSVYSATSGVAGVVRQTAKHLRERGHHVDIFSSDLEAYNEESLTQFPVTKKRGSYFVWFDFINKLKEGGYDIVHVHSYRRPHSKMALEFCKKNNIPCFLTTHAPFKRKRKFLAKMYIDFYDAFEGKKELNSYTKVLAISKWELPILEKMIRDKNKIVYFPNGINDLFFNAQSEHSSDGRRGTRSTSVKPTKKNNIVCYSGRVSPEKRMELLMDAASKLPNLKFKIMGPVSEGYSFENPDNVELINKIYNHKEEADFFKKCYVYVLPSAMEGVPQTLIEAMASGKICVSADNPPARELLGDARGFIFKDDLPTTIKKAIASKPNPKAIEFAKQFSWTKLIDQLEDLYFTAQQSEE